ncbi:MAG: thiamine-monophosphate kinase [Planctomycetes bacterium]|nr:thiamine-monophosphate kinase [Planctomycetota bacterium]
MNKMQEILENALVDSWVRHFPRSGRQINQPHESDAELIEVPGLPDHYLAITTDTVAEEITEGLYREPHTMGWVTIMASLSDLAAVGAEPLGLVVSVCVEPGRDAAFCDGIAEGMADACREAGVFILGGDTNSTRTISLTGCAFGLMPRKEKISRRGCEAGDILFLTGRAGMGNALALARLGNLPHEGFPERLYRPCQRLPEGQLLRRYASCCMDTSDGLLATLDQLMRLNSRGFVIELDWENALAQPALDLCARTGTPSWMMAAGPHGEFELVFTVHPATCEAFLAAARAHGFSPIRIGRVQPRPAITLASPPAPRLADGVELDMAPVRNLLATVGGDLHRYLEELRSWGRKCGLD